MRFVSTRGHSPPATLEDAVFWGPAPDGGLYMPQEIPSLTPAHRENLRERPWPDLVQAVLSALLQGALAPEALGEISANSLGFPIPVVQLEERIHVLELFHGPTLAFKDVGARFMARLLAHFRKQGGPPITVLTATSGDTGGAVADAFHGVPGVRVVILFPEGKVTPRQERQFSTLGGNVLALAVKGDFDDCQRLAKEAFSKRPRPKDQSGDSPGPWPLLTSANSINVGRFLPQITYFFKAWQQFSGSEENRTKILFSVPSGNFGNLAAGLLAKAMGLPGASFLAATNVNDVVPQYLQTGVYAPRPSIPTLSTAMDVGHPSNLERILHLYGGSLDRIRKDVVGQRVSDAETRACIRRVYQRSGYVLDPHSAVSFAALEAELRRRPDITGVVLATAHPAKFAEVVEPVLGESLPIPRELAERLDAERKVVTLEPRLEALKEILDCWGRSHITEALRT